MADLKPKGDGKKAPPYKTLHTLSTVLMAISCLLLLIEMLEMGKTYVGGVLLGIGFLLEAFSRRIKERTEGHNPQNKPALIFGIAAFVIVAGFVFLYLDLR